MTDPLPRAGFTVGSLAEVERSLLPLFPLGIPVYRRSRFLPPFLGFDPSPRPLCRLLTAPSTFYSITGNLSLFSRCPYPYLSFVLLSIVLRFLRRRRPTAPVAVTCESRRGQFFTLKTTLNSSSLGMYFTRCIYFVNARISEK